MTSAVNVTSLAVNVTSSTVKVASPAVNVTSSAVKVTSPAVNVVSRDQITDLQTSTAATQNGMLQVCNYLQNILSQGNTLFSGPSLS